jgi:hypothetical protein
MRRRHLGQVNLCSAEFSTSFSFDWHLGQVIWATETLLAKALWPVQRNLLVRRKQPELELRSAKGPSAFLVVKMGKEDLVGKK